MKPTVITRKCPECEREFYSIYEKQADFFIMEHLKTHAKSSNIKVEDAQKNTEA